MKLKLDFKRIYIGDIVEILNGEYKGERMLVTQGHENLTREIKRSITKGYNRKSIYNIDVVDTIRPYYCYISFHPGDCIIWKSPLKNKIKRICQI